MVIVFPKISISLLLGVYCILSAFCYFLIYPCKTLLKVAGMLSFCSDIVANGYFSERSIFELNLALWIEFRDLNLFECLSGVFLKLLREIWLDVSKLLTLLHIGDSGSYNYSYSLTLKL